ncbi:MAG: tRNA (guanosine(37)-N1)-methyltransferase TrmD [Ignavibacteria bacterium]|jgi:tRNA (guanine37-N1)-methyltransferase|nr:tRNA (guanosine(37)-N1)-methyltransferase TrmD [Ignavibacteria bacterium]
MRIDIISAVPESMESMLNSSIIYNAKNKGLIEIFLHNLHDYALDKFRHIDDAPFGGAAGMLLKCQPIFDCIEKLKSQRNYDEIIFVTPDAPVLTQSDCNKISLLNNIIILCGHYKGIDQRIRNTLITLELSIGDYVLTGGEIPALVIVDSVVRLIPEAIGDSESALDDSLMDGLLESPQYTRPSNYKGYAVPEILLSGNHKEIAKWRNEQSLIKTKNIRPDLLNE